ncbi:MAG: PDZ domain-containing protein [Gemmatimonadota bacterium]|nr:PDZ domain-containing protein [Gemmatimonadota bacterium]
MRINTLLSSAVALGILTSLAAAQQSDERRERDRERGRTIIRTLPSIRARADFENRAILGISTQSSGKRDTLGLLVVSVTPDGPAEKAGIEEGSRLASINAINLRLSAEDAGESDMQGLATRRLVRELGKVDPGDEVELRIWSDGAYKPVRVTTAAREELPGRDSVRAGENMQDRAVVGISLQGTGSRRDSLGILVVRVTADGPAERAGIVEGDRVAAINEVNLRVAGEDAGDGLIASAKSSRFARELRGLKAGDEVELRVWSGGQFKTVRVRTARAGDLYPNERRGFQFFFGDRYSDASFPTPAPMAPMAPLPPMTPMPALAPRARMMLPEIELDGEVEIDHDRLDAARDRAERSIDRALEAMERSIERAREAMERARLEVEVRGSASFERAREAMARAWLEAEARGTAALHSRPQQHRV